jgi:hypothetical protein
VGVVNADHVVHHGVHEENVGGRMVPKRHTRELIPRVEGDPKRPGEACPLCGVIETLRGDAPATDEMDELRAQLDEQRALLAQLLKTTPPAAPATPASPGA